MDVKHLLFSFEIFFLGFTGNMFIFSDNVFFLQLISLSCTSRIIYIPHPSWFIYTLSVIKSNMPTLFVITVQSKVPPHTHTPYKSIQNQKITLKKYFPPPLFSTFLFHYLILILFSN